MKLEFGSTLRSLLILSALLSSDPITVRNNFLNNETPIRSPPNLQILQINIFRNVNDFSDLPSVG